MRSKASILVLFIVACRNGEPSSELASEDAPSRGSPASSSDPNVAAPASSPPTSAAPAPPAAPPVRIVVGGLVAPRAFDVDEAAVYVSATGGITSCEREGSCPNGGSTSVAVRYFDTGDVVAWGTKMFFAARRYANDPYSYATRCARSGGGGPDDDWFLESGFTPIGRLVRGPYHAVWTRPGEPARVCPSSDCTPETMFVVPMPAQPTAIAVSTLAVYSADASHVYASTLSGAATGAVPFANVTSAPVALVEHQGTVAWATPNEIWSKAETAGAAAKKLVTTANGIADLALDASHVYWVNAESGDVLRCPRNGCTGAPESIAAFQVHPKRIRLWDTEIFWMDDASVRARAK